MVRDAGVPSKPSEAITMKEEGMPVHSFASDRGVMRIKLDIQMPVTLSSGVIAWLHQSFPES